MKIFSQKYLEKEGFFPGIFRLLIELPEIFQRKKAINNAINLAADIDKAFNNTLKVTQKGYENSEEQYELVSGASDRLQISSTMMHENIKHTHGLRIEWAESLDQMVKLISGMHEKTVNIQGLVEHLERIQGTLDGLGFQTNISSLNAIINASQTGERGEIFTAVAEKTRKASDDIRDHIEQILYNINGVKDSITCAGDMFANLEKAMVNFRTTSDKIISMSNKILKFSKQQEQTLEQISSIVKKAGQYTRGSRRRYKAISLKESDLKRFLRKANIILRTRKGFWGPYRLNKKVSLDNQRKNIKGVESLVSNNQELIIDELETLISADQEIGSISTKLEIIHSAFQQVFDNTEKVKKIMDRKITDGLEEIAAQSKIFGDKITQITEFLNQVESLSFTMQHSILFNDMLPIVANMAALLVENKNDLLSRSHELDELLNKLKQAANSIEQFLTKANKEVFHIREMYNQLISEINNNRKTCVNISSILENIIKNLMEQPEQIKSVSSASVVIKGALHANQGFAEKINMEIVQLTESITAYYNILDKRSDHPQKIAKNGSS